MGIRKYIVYKITNLNNLKLYIGCHITDNINDSYMGSGKIIKRSMAKNGLDNFQKDILFVFDNETEMFQKEKDLIVELKPEYNLHEGGCGGWSYINKKQPNNEFRSLGGKKSKGRIIDTSHMNTIEAKTKARNTLVRKFASGEITPSFLGKKHSSETKAKISASNKGKTGWNKGIPRSEETKSKIRESLLLHNKNNALYPNRKRRQAQTLLDVSVRI